MTFERIAPLFVTQMKTLITIQSHSSLIILVMMWINYQLNSWSQKSVVDLLCTMGCHSLDGGVNTRLAVQRHAHACTVWYSVAFFDRWSKYKSKCRLSHMQIRKERPTHTVYCIQIHIHTAYGVCVQLINFSFTEFTTFICVIVCAGVCSHMIILLFTVQSAY